MAYVDNILTFLAIWSIQIAAAAIMASIACWLLRKSPGNVHAAIWIAVLTFAWIVPFSPLMIPESSKISFYSPTTDRVNITGSPSTEIRHFKTAGRESARVFSNGQKLSAAPPNSRNNLRNRLRSDSLPVQENKSPSQTVQWTALFKLALLVVWLAGAMAFAVRWIRLRDRIGNILRIAREIEDPLVIETVERTRQLLFLEGPIRTLTADALVAPFVMGLRKPILFLPTVVVKNWSPREIQAVVGHELGHLCRYDLLVHTAMQALRSLFWFWPPVWWMQRELHRAQDAACDECAAVVLGSGLHFGEALARLAEHCLIQDCAFPALGIVHTRHALIKRLENIMNQKIVKLTRISLRHKFTLSVFFILFFGLCGIFTQSVVSQTLDLKLLSNYPDYAIERFLYAPPYHVVFERRGKERFASYYKWENKEWTALQQIKLMRQLGDERVQQAVANNVNTVLVTEDADGVAKVWVVNHQVLDDSLNASFTLPSDGNFKMVRLSGEYLYFLVDFPEDDPTSNVNARHDKGQYIIRVSLDSDYSGVHRENYRVPQNLEIYSFDAYRDSILAIVEEERTVDLKTDSYHSVALGRFGENARLEIDSKRWFMEERDGSLLKYPKQLDVRGNTVFIGFETFDSSNAMTRFDFNVVDWILENDPVVTQEIGVEDLYNYSSLWFSHDASMLGVNVTPLAETYSTPSESIPPYLTVYCRVDGAYQKTATLEDPFSFGSFGDRTLLYRNSLANRFFDVEDLANPQEYPLPVYTPLSIETIAAEQKYVYYLQCESGETKLISLDTAIPDDARIAGEWRLPVNENAKIDAHDSLLAVYESGLDSMHLFSLNSEGGVLEKIEAPSLPEEEAAISLSKLFWDQNVFIAIYRRQAEDDPSRTVVTAYVYDRSDSAIGSLKSKFNLTDRGFGGISYSDGRLILYVDDVNFTEVTEYIHNIKIYSIANPSRPEMLLEYRVQAYIPSPSPYTFSGGSRYILLESKLNPNVLIDLRDPNNPVESIVELPDLIRDCIWYDDLMVAKESSSIIFYQVTQERQLLEIGRHEITDRRVNLSFTPNRMFVSKRSKGLDIYQLRLSSETGVTSWTKY